MNIQEIRRIVANKERLLTEDEREFISAGFMPTLEQIAEKSLEINSAWDEAERCRRRGGLRPEEWKVPRVSEGER